LPSEFPSCDLHQLLCHLYAYSCPQHFAAKLIMKALDMLINACPSPIC
jgi:hypothetical protein